MQPRLWRVIGGLAGALVGLAAFWIEGAWCDGYLLHYGTFPLSRGELGFKLNLLLLILPAMILAAIALGELAPRGLLRGFDWIDGGLGRLWPAIVAAVVLVSALMVRVDVLRATAITDDENVYEFQARILASGRLYLDSQPEPLRPFFDNQFVVNDGRWYGLYFIGHPLLLAAAMRVGAWDLIGPLLAACAALLAIGIARRVGGERVAVLSGVLLASSPFFVFVSATHLSQPTSTLCLALVLYAALRIEDSPRTLGWWLLAALAISFGVLTRPQTAVVLCAPPMARLAWLVLRHRLSPGWRGPAAAMALLFAGAAVVLGVNHALTGSPFRTGYAAYMAQGIAWLYPFGLIPSIHQVSQSLSQLSFWLLGWPVSLALVPLFQRTARAWTLVAVVVATVVWYGLVAVPTVAAVGPVYYAEAIIPLVILSASGLDRLVAFCRNRAGDGWLPRSVVAIPIAGILASLLAFVPVEVSSLRLMANIARAPYDLVRRERIDHALVFVESLPALAEEPGAWVYFHRNPLPDLSDRVLFVKSREPELNRLLMRHFADRTPYSMAMRDGRLALIPIRP